MTNQEAIKMLTSKVECIRRETSGTDIDCNFHNCDDCELCYAQGTTGEQRKALNMAISALQAQDGGTTCGTTCGTTADTTADTTDRQVTGKLEPCKDALDMINNASFVGGDGLDYVEALVALNALKLAGEPCDDCISRSAAIDELKRISFSHWFECGEYLSEDTREIEIISSSKALEAIEALLSAQPEIIRCKDCKYCEHWYADKGRCFLWHESGIDVFGNGFCNYAERREDG